MAGSSMTKAMRTTGTGAFVGPRGPSRQRLLDWEGPEEEEEKEEEEKEAKS